MPMTYRKFMINTASPDHEEAVSHIESEAWVKFADTAMKLLIVRAKEPEVMAKEAANLADCMMFEWRKRFLEEAPKGTLLHKDTWSQTGGSNIAERDAPDSRD